jgi:hypothetical protein
MNAFKKFKLPILFEISFRIFDTVSDPITERLVWFGLVLRAGNAVDFDLATSFLFQIYRLFHLFHFQVFPLFSTVLVFQIVTRIRKMRMNDI